MEAREVVFPSWMVGPSINPSTTFVESGSNNKSEVFKKVKKHRIPPIRRTLTLVLASLQGVGVIIELKNDVEVYGIVEEVDQCMNLTMANARHVFPNGTSRESSLAYINGSTIRYVHIPPEIRVASHLTLYIKTIDKLSTRPAPASISQDNKDSLSSASSGSNSARRSIFVDEQTS